MAKKKVSPTKKEAKRKIRGAGKPAAKDAAKLPKADGDGKQRKRGTPNMPHDIQLLSSKLSYKGPLFSVYTDKIREGERELRRDVIRHHGSAVILAIDDTGHQNDPLIAMERQYRHATGDYLLEIPAGKLEPGENALAGAKRELLEETGFRAKRWRKLVRYFASPGFLGEWMQIFVAEGLTLTAARPEYDEQIELSMVPLSELLFLIEQGRILDGKTLVAVLLYDRMRGK